MKHYMRFLKTFGVPASLMLMFVFVGCRVKPIPGTVHESAEKHDGNRNVTGAPEIASGVVEDFDRLLSETELKSDKAFREGNDGGYFDLLFSLNDYKKKKIATGIIEKILEPLKEIVLSDVYLRDPDYRNDPGSDLYKLLRVFNKGILLAYRSSSEALFESKILDDYREKIFDGCAHDLDGCINVSFFGSDQRTSGIMKIIARRIDREISRLKSSSGRSCEGECLDQVGKFYQTLRMADTEKNIQADSELALLYMKRARDYQVYYQKFPYRQRKLLNEMHLYTFDLAVSYYDPGDPRENTEFMEFIQEFNPWTWSYSNPEWAGFHRAAPKLFSYAAKYYQNNRAIEDAVSKLQASSDALGSPFSTRVNDLFEKSPHLFSYLGIDRKDYEPEKLQNVYFLIIDRLYREHLRKSNALDLWEGSGKDREKLFKTLENYVRIEMLREIQDTTEFMIGIFGRDDIEIDRLFFTVLDLSRLKYQDWIRFFNRITKLEEFVDALFNKTNPPEDYLLLKQRIKRLRVGVKYYSVYPNMMLTSYFMSKLKSKITLQTWFGFTINIMPDTVISSLFEGNQGPWFLFGNDRVPLDKFGILFSYHYALRTGAFETYAGAKLSSYLDPVTKREFLGRVIGGFLNDMRRELIAEKEQLGRVKDPGLMGPFKEVCKDPEGYLPILNLQDVGYYTYAGSPYKGPLRVGYKFFEGGISSNLKKFRTSYEARIKYVMVMIEILSHHIESSKEFLKSQNPLEYGIETPKDYLDVANRYEYEKRELEEVRKVLDEIISLRADYAEEVLALYRDIADCFRRAQKIEFQRHFDLIREEIQHLERVHEAMGIMRQDGPSNIKETLRELEGEYSRITGDTYSYSQYDLLKRIATNLKSPDFGVRKIRPPDKDFLVRWDAVSNEAIRDIPWNDNREKFIGQALSHLNGKGETFLKWFTSRPAENIIDQQKMLVELYRYGLISSIKSDQDCNSKPSLSECGKLGRENILVNEVLKLVRSLHISPEEGEILTGLKLPCKFNDCNVFKDFIVDKSNKSVLLPLLNSTFELVASKESTALLLGESEQVVGSLKSVFGTPGYSKEFFFPMDRRVCQILRGNYRSYVADTETLLSKVVSVIGDKDLQIKDLQINELCLEVDVDGGERLVHDLTGMANPLLDFVEVMKAENRIAGFHERTFGYYLPRPGDIECEKESPPSSCESSIKDYCIVDEAVMDL